MTSISTAPALLERLSAAAKQTLSEREVRNQRISFIMSTVNDENITQAQVEKVVKHSEGN
ncbi:MAG: hypothetical protein ABJ320_19205 [Lentilitoribacter sp.]